MVVGKTVDGEPLLAVFMPSLIAVLIAEERKRGRPLQAPEAEAIRDAATVVAVPQSAVAAIDEGRGYTDIDPERCYEDYLRVRGDLVEHDFGSDSP